MSATLKQAQHALHHMDFPHAVEGKEIYNFFGNRVLEHTTSTGAVLAIKVKPHEAFECSEADMMQYAASNGVMAPEVRGMYDIMIRHPIARVLVSKRVPGVSLDTVWFELSDQEQSRIKEQLRTQLAQMRTCTQPFIGRVGRQHTRNVYDSILQTFCGPFADSKEFDKWCLSRLRTSPFARWKWRRFLERERRDFPTTEYVLTHGDLTPRNIMVDNGELTGIVDWEKSGFFPRYAEYAFAFELCHQHEEWWMPVLEEMLEPCSKQRLEFTKLVEDTGFWRNLNKKLIFCLIERMST